MRSPPSGDLVPVESSILLLLLPIFRPNGVAKLSSLPALIPPTHSQAVGSGQLHLLPPNSPTANPVADIHPALLGWDQELYSHPDKEFAASIVTDIQEGFRIDFGHHHIQHFRSSTLNMGSAYDHLSHHFRLSRWIKVSQAYRRPHLVAPFSSGQHQQRRGGPKAPPAEQVVAHPRFVHHRAFSLAGALS